MDFLIKILINEIFGIKLLNIVYPMIPDSLWGLLSFRSNFFCKNRKKSQKSFPANLVLGPKSISAAVVSGSPQLAMRV